MLLLLFLLSITLVTFPMHEKVQTKEYDYSGWAPIVALSKKEKKERDDNERLRQELKKEELRKMHEKWKNEGMLPPA